MSDLAPMTFVRWNDAESRFVPTTADDPRRVLVKADTTFHFWKWALATAAGALFGAWVVETVKK